MGAYSHFPLQKAIYQSLIADSALMALVTGIYDRVTEGSACPYVTIGDIQSRDWSTKTSIGMQLMVTLHVFSREGGRKQSADIMDRIHTLLHQSNLTVAGHTLIMLRFDVAEIELESDGLTYHGTMRFRALTEAA